MIPNPGERTVVTGCADGADRLRTALDEANVPTLLMVLVHLTGDRKWLDAPYRPTRARGLEDNDGAGLPLEIQDEIRAAAYRAVLDHRAGKTTPLELTPVQIADMLAVALGEDVPHEYGPLLAEELGVLTRDVPIARPRKDFRVGIIGAGMSGLCAAIKLDSAGIDFEIIEKNQSVGGTWLENTYPGCGVDTPSHLYSFSFAPNTKWSRYFAKRDEVDGYLEELADRYAVRDRIRFGEEVEHAEYDNATNQWVVSIRPAGGDPVVRRFDVLISAVGMVNRPAKPSIPGLEDFGGPVMHTAEWDPSVAIEGKRVAVIGTGASAMQLVPSIADLAERVMVFQRSKQWALPHPNYQRSVSADTRLLLEEVPFYANWYRLRAFWNFSDRLHSSLVIDPEWERPAQSINATNEKHRVFLTNHIIEQLGDRQDLLDACLPDYPPYGKRPLVDNGWFRTVCRDDVDLITSGTSKILPGAVVDGDGVPHEADVLVLATGFKTLQFLWPMEIRGRSGRTLAEVWGPEDARAHLGVTVPDFPNFYILNGPNTNAGHGGSAIIATEFQMRYIAKAIDHMIANDLAEIEVREDIFTEYNLELDAALAQMIWSHPGMTTYYRNGAGRVVVSSPWKYLDYWNRIKDFDPAQYRTTTARSTASA
ncbi:flavin-containing monooxygenase [Nocardia sp. NPDC059246]|uniref:flavin-containing monooxygenase n=1 Tax=unclassified Nocardia TaxID=2637762 RepID=UPI003687A7EF